MNFPVIGVTGLPCSGKSHAAGLLASGAVPGLPPGELLKADDMGHEVLTRPDVVRELRARFGEDAFASAEPSAVRGAIAERVFADPATLVWLEGLIHPLVLAGIDAALERNRGRRPVVMEAALLVASGMDRRCDRLLLIEADFGTRLRRAAARGWDREELLRRERRLLPLFETAKKGSNARMMRIVQNDGDDGLITRLCSALDGLPEKTPMKG
ncbi:MAG: dephospho-CoA kinase [Planctomycetota bacterium]|jgi:dephospho-CoA kinase|nr:dephospho-CoA kinase [Planctomycetota bacterium]